MVYTLTLNPAIDYLVYTDKFELGNINKSERQKVCPGGKGINVSLVLNELSVENTALGMIAGFTGDHLEKMMLDHEIKTDFIKMAGGITRINVKLRNGTGIETDINSVGCSIDKDSLDMLFDKIRALKEGDILCLCGSIPHGMDSEIYSKILDIAKERRVDFAIDTTGDALVSTLKYHPIFIKPNKSELETVFERKIEREDIGIYAEKLIDMGAQNVLVSLGEDGAVLCDSGKKETYMPAFKGRAVNTVGAGDACFAGFLAGIIKGMDKKEALRLAMACGGASAFGEGLCSADSIEKLLST